MPDEFILRIDLDNEAMRYPDHVAEALRRVATRLDRADAFPSAPGLIRDVNGNGVGEYVAAAEAGK